MLNPAWIPAYAALLGMLVNLIWTVVNMKLSRDLLEQLADLKIWFAKEYVSTQVCELRRQGCPAVALMKASEQEG